VTGAPVIIFLSNVNFGRVDTMGLEVALDYTIGPAWNFEFNYSWLDFDPKELLLANPLGANAPDNKLNAGVVYTNGRFTGSAYYRWFDSFRWEEGTLNGPVPSYNVVNVIGLYDLSEALEIGVNVSNLFDDQHWEMFGGDVMELRAMAHVAYRWR
jgi:outer membrane receptor protein involved in Fe transport